jgi:ribosomal protein S18 acetylase RimI-like enzyme
MERFELLTQERWNDFVTLFEKHKGVRGGCWCSFYLASAGEYAKLDKEDRKLFHFEKINRIGFTGGLYYADNLPVAWCQFGQKKVFHRFERNQHISDMDISDDGVWRISCIFTDKEYRKRGYARKVTEAAIETMIQLGAHVIEAFPFDFTDRPNTFQHNGSVEFYSQLGFQKIGKISKNEVLMRKRIEEST